MNCTRAGGHLGDDCPCHAESKMVDITDVDIAGVTWTFWTDPWCGDIVGACDAMKVTASGKTMEEFLEDARGVMRDTLVDRARRLLGANPPQPSPFVGMPVDRQIVELDSYAHYKTEERDGKIVLLEFNDDGGCPRMGDREDFSDDEGTPIASWKPGETVIFVYGKYEGVLGVTKGVVCGDDIRYDIKS